jgi:outer membrane protein
MWIFLPLPSRRLSVFLAAVFLLATPLPGHSEDLLAVYRQAAATSPVLARARALLDADRADRPLARSGLMPRLGLAAGVRQGHADISGFGPLEVDESYTGNSYSVTLTQPVFNGPAYVALNAAGARIRAGEATVLAAGQQLILNVTEAYFDVLRARADLEVARGERDLLKSVLDQTETFREVGSGDVIAVHEARARHDAADSARVRAENTLGIARQALERLTHRPGGALEDLGPLQPRGPSPDSSEKWVQAALYNQPLLSRVREELRAARDQVEISSRARWPRIDIDAAYGHAKGEFLPSIKRDEWTVGLNLKFPIYQGGEIGARTQQAEALASAGRYELKDRQDQVKLDTATAFRQLKNSVAELQAATQALQSARVSLAATQDGYRVGVRSIIDLLTVVQDHASAQRNYFLALYSHVVDRVRLKAAAGVLSEKDVEAVNALLKDKGAGGS